MKITHCSFFRISKLKKEDHNSTNMAEGITTTITSKKGKFS